MEDVRPLVEARGDGSEVSRASQSLIEAVTGRAPAPPGLFIGKIPPVHVLRNGFPAGASHYPSDTPESRDGYVRTAFQRGNAGAIADEQLETLSGQLHLAGESPPSWPSPKTMLAPPWRIDLLVI